MNTIIPLHSCQTLKPCAFLHQMVLKPVQNDNAFSPPPPALPSDVPKQEELRASQCIPSLHVSHTSCWLQLTQLTGQPAVTTKCGSIRIHRDTQKQIHKLLVLQVTCSKVMCVCVPVKRNSRSHTDPSQTRPGHAAQTTGSVICSGQAEFSKSEVN